MATTSSSVSDNMTCLIVDHSVSMVRLGLGEEMTEVVLGFSLRKKWYVALL